MVSQTGQPLAVGRLDAGDDIIVAVRIPDDRYRRYYEDRLPAIDWVRAMQVISSGEPDGEFFTLPWWQTESTSVFLYGERYNKGRLAELRQLPGKTKRGRGKWRPGVLCPGVPDEWSSEAVEVMTQAGHVGCVQGDMSSAGLGRLVRELDAAGQHFVVPLRISASDVAVPVPEGPDLSAFDYPWVGNDPDRYKKPRRINRSHVMGLLMLKRGFDQRWLAMAKRIAGHGEQSGVTVRPSLRLFKGSRVMVNVRSDEAEAAINQAAEWVGFEPVERPKGYIDEAKARGIGKIDALITRYPESHVGVCEYARKHGIPIYRPDEFVGGLAEAVLADAVLLER